MSFRPLTIEGLPIRDAKTPLTVNVTRADIATASVKKPDNCAVARACRRSLHVKEVRVHLSRIYLRTNDKHWVRYKTPLSMRNEIIAFDRGGKFEPSNFTIIPLQETQKAKARQTEKRYPVTGKGGPRKRRKLHILTNVRGGPG